MKVYNKIFDINSIARICEYQYQQPESHRSYTLGKTKAIHRNLNLEIDDTINDIIFPPLQKIFPDFKVDTGSFLTSQFPYGLHNDTNKYHSDLNLTKEKQIKYDSAVLIPLTQEPSHKTIFFDYYNDLIDKTVLSNGPEIQNDLDLEIKHLSETDQLILKRVKISEIYEWKVGDIVTWPRNQLHCAGDHTASGVFKQAIVIFIL